MPTETVRTRLSGAERRELILDGAAQVFAEQGYNDASMAAIARAAGITPAVIYDHFSSKQELHIELLEKNAHALLAFVSEAVLAVGDDPVRRLNAGIRAYFDFIAAHQFTWRLLLRDPPADPEIASVYSGLFRQATQALTLLIAASAPDTSDSSDHRMEMYGQMLLTSLNGLASWWYEHPDVPVEELVERVIEFCWTGLEARVNPPVRERS